MSFADRENVEAVKLRFVLLWIGMRRDEWGEG